METQFRIWSFLFLCLCIRILFVYINYSICKTYLPILGIFYLIISIGFFYTFMYSTSTLGAFGRKIWWNNLRLIHSLIYFICAIASFLKNRHTYILLIVDIIIGFSGFITQYFRGFNFLYT